jgi:site-specific recombinase XerD
MLIMKFQELLGKIKNELKLRNYSQKTIKSYLSCLDGYFKHIKTVKKDPDPGLIKEYLLEKLENGQSSQTINLHPQAIKYFYREICKSPL